MAQQVAQKLEVDIKLAPTLQLAFEDTSDSICLVGPVGSGKTSWGALKIVSLMRKYADKFPFTRWVVVRGTYRELQDTTEKSYFYWYPPKGYNGNTYWLEKFGRSDIDFGEFNKGDDVYHFRMNVNGKEIKAEFLFRSAENGEDDVKKFKGAEIMGYHLDEAIEIPKEIHMILAGRLGRYAKDWPRSISILTTNPPHERHWIFKDYFGPDKIKGYAGYKQPPGENSENLPDGYYEKLKEQYKNNPDWINRYVNGNWGIILTGEKVFPEFHSDIHSMDGDYTPVKTVPIIRGWDFGLTPACSFSQLLPDGQWVIFDEMQEFNKGAEKFSNSVVMHSRLYYGDFRFFDYADPAGWKMAESDEKTCVQVLNKKGIYPNPGEVTFTARREAVARYLNTLVNGKPALQIYRKKCPMLFDGFSGGYCYPKNKDGLVVRDRPIKNDYSHTQDSVQYVASRLLQFQMQYLQDSWEPKDLAASYA
jgi:hypothetical protein